MPHLQIKRRTPVMKMAVALRNEMIKNERTLDDCSEWSFSGRPIANKLQPYWNEQENEPEARLIWLVVSGKRAFLYVPNDTDQEALNILNNNEDIYRVGSDCLDVSKILTECPMREVKKLLREIGSPDA